MTRQRGSTIVTPIVPEEVPHLERLLNDDGDPRTNAGGIDMARLGRLHYASFVVFADAAGAPQLLFEANFDGRRDDFLRDVLRTSPGAVDAVYRHCVGYPAAGTADRHAVLDYLRDHDLGAGSFYIAWPGRSVDDIRREHRLRGELEAALDGPLAVELRGKGPQAIHRRLVQHVRATPDLAWATTPPTDPFLVRNGDRVAGLGAAAGIAAVASLAVTALRPSAGRRPRLAAAAALAGLAGGAAGLVVRLLVAERRDDARDRARDWQAVAAEWSENVAALRRREDVDVQNHMLGVTTIKPGPFRLAVLHVVLWAIALAARLRSNRGSLGGISSIHFARWVVTRDRKQLLFLSNYDGSWERYLDDFIDLAAGGLTAVWTNTDNEVGFPTTTLLVRNGARQEARFKAYARRSMVPTNSWYSAYPDVTVPNIAANRELRRGMSSPLDDGAARAWLRRL